MTEREVLRPVLYDEGRDEVRLLDQRLLPAEKIRLAEYRRLLDKVLLLPGFEFTATFGFHIIGVFSPETPMRDLEHLLLSLNVTHDRWMPARPWWAPPPMCSRPIG